MHLKDLNDQQNQAVMHGTGPLLIVAGAGTGKTTVITERVAWLIEQNRNHVKSDSQPSDHGARADEILALTFTDKAATEMEERVDRLLPYGYTDLWIMTFHSFCERILKQHALDIGIPNDFKLLNQTEQWLLVRQNLEKFNLDYYRPLGSPTKFIHALIKHFSRCKDEEIWPSDYLEYAEKLKVNLDSMESTGGVARNKKQETRNKEISNFKFQISNKSQIPNSRFQIPDSLDSSEIKRLEEVANAYHVYQQLLLDNESLDFGDLINYALKLFRTRPNVLKKYQQQFKYILVDEFQDTNWAQYELVKLLAGDDRNLTVVGDDDQSIYKFRGASVSNILQFKNDFIESKEIYLTKNYRSAQNILDLAYNFIQLNNPERLEAKLQNVETPRRGVSTDIKQLSKKLESQINKIGIIKHLHAQDESEEVRMVVNKILELYNKKGDPSAPQTAPDVMSGLSGSLGINCGWNDFAILVRANNQAEPFLNGLRAANIPYNFVASKGLYSKEVVMDVLAYLKLLDNYHESLALWRILNLPVMQIKVEDLMELTRFANRKTLSLYEVCQQINFLKNLEEETKRKINKILKLISEHSHLSREKSVKQVVLNFLNDFGYEQFLLNKNDEQSFVYLNQLIKKIDDFSAKDGSAFGGKNIFGNNSVKNFINLIELELSSGEQGSLSKELEEGPEAVKIMTVHSAKGLEFKYVFIVNLVDKRFPSMERSESIELPDELVKEIIPSGDIHLQEERRLFYVAMTRAKCGLFFTSAENYGGKTKKKLSRFIYEVGLVKDTKQKEKLETRNKKIETQKYKDKLQVTSYKLQNKKLQVTSEKLCGNLVALRNYQLPTAFSYSQLKTFETCPYQYYLAFILKVPVKGKASFSYGKTLHATLQNFFSLIKETGRSEQRALFAGNTPRLRSGQAGNTPGLSSGQAGNTETQKTLPIQDTLLEIYNHSWVDDWYESKEQKETYRKQGEKSLKNLYEQLQKNGVPQILELEKGFNFKIENYTIKGVIDRVDKIDQDKVEIIDYKTGRPKTEKTIEKDQLLIYQIAVQETFGFKPEKLTFYYLDDNSTVSFLGTEKEIEKQKEKIFGLIDKIKTAGFTATPSQFACGYCDFKEICQYKM